MKQYLLLCIFIVTSTFTMEPENNPQQQQQHNQKPLTAKEQAALENEIKGIIMLALRLKASVAQSINPTTGNSNKQ